VVAPLLDDLDILRQKLHRRKPYFGTVGTGVKLEAWGRRYEARSRNAGLEIKARYLEP